MSSFNSESSSGFLARAEAARGSDSSATRDQFSRLEVGNGSFNMRNEGMRAEGSSGVAA